MLAVYLEQLRAPASHGDLDKAVSRALIPLRVIHFDNIADRQCAPPVLVLEADLLRLLGIQRYRADPLDMCVVHDRTEGFVARLIRLRGGDWCEGQ